ncbi:gamma-aminobutyric acid receptor subunit rho-1 [Exaiptasia diaphana]|uniref:Gamma-aminobutyric acid receptor subunit beta n=1 Tax=Exaiptasia diaphana TaxID=2652724 RepID=A0A913XRK3_EXADI|nr:gamma-aminobutyric acid receptor subunit rho-1 [Exaiptasia diaphana]XP_020908101.1 gamma-aminobutyric acid receptor subunit rho-1 [Exaiptasia diaphana]XP_020908109.1 gamma-aminobutyric acid receptor subunit rho-1 [Exaiptasia diaphana]XP_028517017.1 gamma-aminobutyric acid receptor subunit rho-1 [Exaiptasia diaphana]KXJ20118.1 Gamma-aminobutyric acid receptor subunit beta-3 [Exaiptasia diaphana]
MEYRLLTILLLLNINYFCATKAQVGESLEEYAESMEEAKNLSDFINHAIKAHDKKVRPNAGGPSVMVQVEFKVVSFGEIKEAEMTYSMDIFFRQWWYDSRFAHNMSKAFTMAADATQIIWTPDTYFWNVKSAKYHKVTRENMRVMINPDGKIYFSTRITISAQCDMNLRLYPMDIQYCPLIIESYAHTRSDVDYKWKGGKDQGIEIVSKEMAQFEFMGANTTTKEQANSKGSFASLRAEFVFKRRVSFFITATYMPAMILVILSWCTFWIHRNAVPARVTLSITTILSTILLTSTVNASMPKVSYSKALDYYLMTSLGFIFMTLLEYVIVLNIHPNLRKEHREDDEIPRERQPLRNDTGKDHTPDTIVTMMDKTGNGRQSTTSKFKTCLSSKPVKAKDKKQLPYLDVHWIDRTARVLFPFCYFSFTIAYWIYYINHPLTDFQLF